MKSVKSLLGKLPLWNQETDPVGQEYVRLQALPRHQPTVTTVPGFPVKIPDAHSFIEMYYEIFEEQVYRFKTDSPCPTIIDGGANIGLSVLFFKQIYPDSHIIAFEPDPELFAYLKQNIASGACADVELICAAIAARAGQLDFIAEGSYAGRLALEDEAANNSVTAVRLRDYLQQPVDLLKLDIEGAETAVLQDCADLLGNVQNIAMEYHSFVDRPQTLDRLLHILAQAGFRVHINPVRTVSQPLMQREIINQMDLQLFIAAYRA